MPKISFKHSVFASIAVLTVAFMAPIGLNAQSAYARDGQAETENVEQHNSGRTQKVEAETENVEQHHSGSTLEAEHQTEDRQRAEVQKKKDDVKAEAKEKHEAIKGRLEAAKLKVCQSREKNIKNIMARMGDRSTKQLDVFTKISERTQAFYVKKGNVLAGYDALVAAVAEKKLAAEAAVKSAQDIGGTFSCDGESPRSVAASFKESMQARNNALKEYKTAVKNLIVGVKSVQSTTNESTSEAKS